MLLVFRAEGRFFTNKLTKRSIPPERFPIHVRRNLILRGGYCSHGYDNLAASNKIEPIATPQVEESSTSSVTESRPTVSQDVPSPSNEVAVSSEPYSTPPQIIQQLTQKYSYKFQYCTFPHLPNCEFFFCGTLHVANTSVNMVKDVIQTIKPNYVVIELCENRIDGILEDSQYYYEDEVNNQQSQQNQQQIEQENITFFQILRKSLKERSIKTLGMGLLTWMQINAAKLVGSKLGGELSIACYISHKIGSTVILGDRLYHITIQRIFDSLTFYEKCKMILVILWEILTMSIFKLKDYIQKTDEDASFIKDELDRFAEYLPAFAKVVISERDEYLAQTLYEVANIAFEKNKRPSSRDITSTPGNGIVGGSTSSGMGGTQKGRIVVVIGAGHLHGVQKNLAVTPLSDERMMEISSSSKHANSWPGRGVLQVVDMKQIVNAWKSMESPPSPRF
eukprot:gene12096-13225_t